MGFAVLDRILHKVEENTFINFEVCANSILFRSDWSHRIEKVVIGNIKIIIIKLKLDLAIPHFDLEWFHEF